NSLTFDFEEEIAAQFGADPASWMRQYFSQAREIHRAAVRAMESAEEQTSSLLVQFRDWRSRLANADFSLSRERAYFRAPQRLEGEPLLAIALFQFVARHGVRLSEETERRLVGELPRLREYFASKPRPALWPMLKEILTARHRVHALRLMHQTGVLAALFPEWDAIDCLVIRDFYHRYTVDEHTLAGIEILDELASGGDPAKEGFAELLSEVGDPELLAFAMLFHDTGKGQGAGSHAAASAVAAARAMERIGMPEHERETVRLLIDRHLDLSEAMTARDLEDPATARDLAGRAGTVETLKKLVLLTYADVGAVNPTAMSAWRRTQLWRAYLATSYELTRELEQDRIEPAAGGEEFLEGFPVRYLRTHRRAEIEAHLELERRARARGVALDIRKEDGFYRLTLVARDRPSLLSSIAGALSGFGMNILQAEGFSNRYGQILDTFSFSDPHRTLELNPQETDRLRIVLERVALGKQDVTSLLRGRPKPAAPSGGSRIPPSISFDNTASTVATLVQIVAEDRPALLYDLTAAISSVGANIDLVLIDTQAHKAIDVFYVTVSGAKLDPGRQAALAAALRKACAG
ncbi:MAG: HD domain-containing protein, partial [Bryobacteraceae bacterium]